MRKILSFFNQMKTLKNKNSSKCLYRHQIKINNLLKMPIILQISFKIIKNCSLNQYSHLTI